MIINNGTVIATGSEAVADIGGGWDQPAGDIIINGGTVIADHCIGHCPIASGIPDTSIITVNGGTVRATDISKSTINGGTVSATHIGNPTNSTGEPIYLTELTIPGQRNQSVTAASIDGVACAADPDATQGVYGISDVSTDDDGKLYFWLPASLNNKLITVTVNGIEYGGFLQITDNPDNNIQTMELAVTSISLVSGPDRVDYVEGDALDLTGLVVRLHMSDGSSEDVAFNDFPSKGITTSPTNGQALSVSNNAVTITCTAYSKSVNQPIMVSPSPANYTPTGNAMQSNPTVIDRSKPPVIGVARVTAKKGAGNTATAVISREAVADAIAKAQAEAERQGKTDRGIEVSLSIDRPSETSSLSVVLSQDILTRLTAMQVSILEIDSDLGRLCLDLEAIKEIQRQSSGDITINMTPVTELSDDAEAMIGERPVYNITISYEKNGKTVYIDSLGKGKVTLSIPYIPDEEENVSYLFGVYVDGDGNATRIEDSAYDAGNRSIVLGSNHFSIYGVGYLASEKGYKDISAHWAKESIDYVTGRGLIDGITATAFSPDTSIRLGMLVTALGRMAGVDISKYGTVTFTDVEADRYYAPYMEWAYENGIINQYGNGRGFPEAPVTRQETALILSKYAKATGYTLPVTREAVTFADADLIGSAYQEAVAAMQKAGIMMGRSDNLFHPGSNMKRAEAAAMLHRYIKLAIDPATAQGWAVNDAGQYIYYEDGKAVTGWFDIDGGDVMKPGRLDADGGDSMKRYYFTEDGIMVSGKWLELDGKWYYFNTDGTLAVSTKVDGYEVDEDGERKAKTDEADISMKK